MTSELQFPMSIGKFGPVDFGDIEIVRCSRRSADAPSILGPELLEHLPPRRRAPRLGSAGNTSMV